MKRALEYLQRLNCPSALTWPTWLVAFAPSVSTAVLHDRNLYGGSAVLWLLAAIVGALAAGAVLWIAAVTLTGRHPLGVLLSVFLVAGAARGVGVGWTAAQAGLVSDPQFEVRAISGAILAVFWLSIATLIVQGFRSHRSTRMELEQLERTAEREHRAAVAELAQMTSRTDTDVTSRVVETIDRLRDGSCEGANCTSALIDVAETLHTISAGVVRPLSHDAALTITEPAAPPRPSRMRAYVTILVDAVTVDPFRPWWVAALLFPSILMTAIRNYGFGWGILGAAWIVAMAAIVLVVARRTLRPLLRGWPWPLRAVAVVGVWVVAAGASAVPVAMASAWGLGPERAWAVFGVPLLAYVPTTCLGVAIAAAISLSWALDEDARQSRIAALTWHTQVAQQGIWAERMRLGRFLHGSVQATLTSTALRIETSLAKGQSCAEIAAAAIAHLEQLVTDMAARGGELVERIDVTEVLRKIAAVWSRVATIDCDVDPGAHGACAQDADAAEKVVEIVRENITNAIRHGHASDIRADVTRSHEGSIVITVSDNGHAGAHGGSPGGAGLGSTMLDDMCLEWSRTYDGGTVVTCRVATNAPVDSRV